MSFVPQNELEHALIRATSDPLGRPSFYHLLFTSELIVIGEVKGRDVPKNQRVASQAGDSVRIASMERNGQPVIPLFSSLPRLQAFTREEVGYVAMNGRTLFEMTKGTPLVLNPGSDYGKELLPEEIADLLDPKPTMVTVDTPTNVLIGQPAVYPHPLINALKAAFAARSDIAAAYLVQIGFPDITQPPHPLIGIETSAPWEELCKEIGRIGSKVAPGLLVDAYPIERGKPTTLGDALLATTPFYVRNK